MQRGRKPVVAWTAILAIALQAVLAGLAGWSPATAASFDPATIICHSETSDAGADRHVPGPATPGHCCAQCILCNSLPVASTPANAIVLLPPLDRLGAALVPFSSIESARSRNSGISLPRGPPIGI